MFGVEPGTGSGLVLEHIGRPFDPEKLTAALLGLSTRVTRQIVGAILATSDEAQALLDAMPAIVRSMAIATTDQPERCIGEIRGPVLWGETMSARSASAGDPGLFVCATTTKAYDTDANRVLKAALAAVQRAGHFAEHGLEGPTDEVVRRARHNGQQAARLLDHQTLAQVPIVRPTGRSLKRTRAGSRRHTYQPALALLGRAADPIGAEHLDELADDRTRAQHDLLAATLQHLGAILGRPPVLRVEGGAIVGGPLTYHHAGRSRDPDHLDGIKIGDVLVDVPDPLGRDVESAGAELAARAGGRRTVLATAHEDIARAVRLAIS